MGFLTQVRGNSYVRHQNILRTHFQNTLHTIKPTTKHSPLFKDANAKYRYHYRAVYPYTVASSWRWMYSNAFETCWAKNKAVTSVGLSLFNLPLLFSGRHCRLLFSETAPSYSYRTDRQKRERWTYIHYTWTFTYQLRMFIYYTRAFIYKDVYTL